MNNSTAFSLAALRTPVMVPPARPAAYARSIDGYFTLSGALNVSEPNLYFDQLELKSECSKSVNLECLLFKRLCEV